MLILFVMAVSQSSLLGLYFGMSMIDLQMLSCVLVMVTCTLSV
jgi:hypothetical protein